MTLSDYLKPYYLTQDMPIEPIRKMMQARLNTKLKELFKAWEKLEPNIKLLNQFILKADPTFHPDSVQAIFNDFGWITYEDMKQWFDTTKIKNLDGLINQVFPILSLPQMQKYTTSEMFDMLQIATGCDAHMTDSFYQMLPDNQLDYLINACPSDKYQFVNDSRDCDDFSRIFRGWLSEQGYGNLSVGYCEYQIFDSSNKMIFYHAVNIVATESRKVYIIEPQEDKPAIELSDIHKTKLNGVRAEIVWIVM